MRCNSSSKEAVFSETVVSLVNPETHIKINMTDFRIL